MAGYHSGGAAAEDALLRHERTAEEEEALAPLDEADFEGALQDHVERGPLTALAV